MTQERPLFVTALTIVISLGSAYWLVVLIFILLSLVGVLPSVKVETAIPGIGIELARTLAFVLAVIGGILFLVSTYGLWTRRRWSGLLVALIIALDLLSRVWGKSIIEFFSLTVGNRTRIIDFTLLLEVVLLVAVLSLPRISAATVPSKKAAEQTPKE